MRPHSVLTGLAVLACALPGCDSNPVSSGGGPCPECVTIASDAGPGSLLDPLVIDGATIAGDVLTLDVTYSGGCREHDFRAIAPPAFEDSPSVALRVYVRHDGHGDACEALVPETLEFDLTPVRELYLATYGEPGELGLLLVTPEADAVSVAYDLR